jgi:hypothetical protein
MWYKTAKYGTLWDRLGPGSEQELDRILDESTVVEKIVDPKTKTEKQVKSFDFKKLDQLLKETVLSKKGVLNKILVEAMDDTFGAYWSAIPDKVPLIQTKIFNIPINIKRNLDKVIKFNPKYSTGRYIWTRASIKHEISHAISTAVLPQNTWRSTESSDSPEKELYLQPGTIAKEDVRENYKETGQFLSFNKIRKAIFLDKLPNFEKFLSVKLGPDYIKEYLIENLDESTLPQRAEKINNLFLEFNQEVNIGGLNLYFKRINKVNKDELGEIKKIEYNPYVASSIGTYHSPGYKEELDKGNAELEKRSKLLIPGGDLYYANPEETRSNLAEFKELFSLNSVKEYYSLQNYTTPKEQHIPEFLNLIKTIFNEAVIHGDSGNFYHINNYFHTFNMIFYNSSLYIKRYDLKFQRQLAKILNENYQQIKTYFNNMLIEKKGE